MPVGIQSLEDFSNYNTELGLQIYSSNNGFIFDFMADSGPRRFQSGLTEQDLLQINTELRRKLEPFIFGDINGRQKSFHELAYYGYNAFINIFKRKHIREELKELFSHGNATIKIYTDTFFIPWEFLYFENPDEIMSYENFWGFKLIIARYISREDDSSIKISTSPIINYDLQPKLGLITYENLSNVKNLEIPFFNDLARDGRILLEKLRSLDSNISIRKSEIIAFKDFCSNQFNILHFACHAKYEKDHLKESHIRISDNFKLSIMDIENNEITIEGAPLIIINACETGNLNPLYSLKSSMVGNFWQQGALGVVATEYEIPDTSAAEFIQIVYQNLLSHQPLGISLLNARKQYFKQTLHPVGLLYSMYAAPNIQLKPIN